MPCVSRRHSAPGDDARHDVEGDQPLGRLVLAIDGEGDAGLAEDALGVAHLFGQPGRVLLFQPAIISRIRMSETGFLRLHFVERNQARTPLWRHFKMRRGGKASAIAQFGQSVGQQTPKLQKMWQQASAASYRSATQRMRKPTVREAPAQIVRDQSRETARITPETRMYVRIWYDVQPRRRPASGDGATPCDRLLQSSCLLSLLFVLRVCRRDAEIRAAQGTIEAQLKAFLAGDARAGLFLRRAEHQADIPDGRHLHEHGRERLPAGAQAAATISFGKVQEMGATSIIQQVMIVGPDGKDYEAVYTLELQPDGIYRITGVSLRAANSLST